MTVTRGLIVPVLIALLFFAFRVFCVFPVVFLVRTVNRNSSYMILMSNVQHFSAVRDGVPVIYALSCRLVKECLTRYFRFLVLQSNSTEPLAKHGSLGVTCDGG